MEDESVQDSDTSQQVGQTPDLLDVLPDGAVEDPAGGQDNVLGEGGIKALRAERAARKAAERQLKESQQALLEAQDAQRAVQSELFELRFEQEAAPMCAYPELLRKIGDWDDAMSAEEIRAQATKIITKYPKLAPETVNRDIFTRCAKEGYTSHTINAIQFADAVRDTLGR